MDSAAAAAEQHKSPQTFTDPNLYSMILNGLNQQRQESKCTDIIISSGTSSITAHKAVLSAFSPYFENFLYEDPYNSGE